jgi:hypothetical protein
MGNVVLQILPHRAPSSSSASGSGVREDITSWAGAMTEAVGATLGTIIQFIDSHTDDAALPTYMRVVTLRVEAGTDATDLANGVARPDDYAGGTREVVLKSYTG